MPLVKRVGAYTETTIDDEIVVMSLATGDFFSLTGTARDIWLRLDRQPDRAGLTDALTADYGDAAAIRTDLDSFLAALIAAGLVDES